MARIEECSVCAKPFAVTVGSNGVPGALGDIRCPHCQAVWSSEQTAGLYVTDKLTLKQLIDRAFSRNPRPWLRT